MEQRLGLIRAVDEDGMSVAAACRMWKVSRETYYVWRRRYKEEGTAGLEDRTSRPQASPGRIDWKLESEIVEIRKAHKRWGARRIRTELKRNGRKNVPAISTTHTVLVRHGLVVATPPSPKPTIRFEREAPGDLWQTDAKDVELTTGQLVRVFSLVDDHSRLCCAARAREHIESSDAIAAFDEAVSQYGLPYSVLADRGKCFTGRTTNTVGPYERHLWGFGVMTLNGRPYHPQTQGKVERYHRTLSEWLEDHGPFNTIDALQVCLDEFRHDYNNLRPHQAIGDITPAERWAATVFRGADPEGTADRRVRTSIRRVGSNGNFSYGDWVIALGRVWAKASVKLVDYGHVLEVRDEFNEVIRKVDPDPDRRYLATGRPKGRPSVKAK